MSLDAKWYAGWIRLLPASSAAEKQRNLEAADLMEEIDKRIPHWISVEERLPEGEVIAANFAPGTYGYKEYLLGYVHKHDDLYYAENSFEILNTVTHWMPIPQPTKE